MPIYEYRCVACGRKTEQFVWPGENEPDMFCDECGSKMEKVPSRFGFRFKDPIVQEPIHSGPKFPDDDEAPDFDNNLT